jgi:hypothetical protein
MDDDNNRVELAWTPRVTFMGRLATFSGTRYLEHAGAGAGKVICWKLSPSHPAMLAMILGKTPQDINRMSKDNGVTVSISTTETWKQVIVARNETQANLLLSDGPIDQALVSALYEGPKEPQLAPTLKGTNPRPKKSDNDKQLITVQLGDSAMRCVAPVSQHEALSVAIEEESLSTVLQFLSVGIRYEVVNNPDVLVPRTYSKRKADETDAQPIGDGGDDARDVAESDEEFEAAEEID